MGCLPFKNLYLQAGMLPDAGRSFWQYSFKRKIVLRISSFVVSGWIVQSRRTFFPFSSVVKTPAYPLEIICLEICRFRQIGRAHV